MFKIKTSLDNANTAQRIEFLVFPTGSKEPVSVSMLGEDHYRGEQFVTALSHATARLVDQCCDRDSKGRVIPSSLRYQVVRRLLPSIPMAA